MSVQILSAPLWVQLPAYTPEKAAEDGPSHWALAFTWKTWVTFLTPCCGHLGSVPADGKFIHNLSLSLFPPKRQISNAPQSPRRASFYLTMKQFQTGEYAQSKINSLRGINQTGIYSRGQVGI